METDLVGKKVVIALGGNALGDNPKEQLKLLDNATKHLAEMVKEGIDVVITHGNGPQVGVIDSAFVIASKQADSQVPFMPLYDCNAMSQGYIGTNLTCSLMNQFREMGIMRSVVDVPTHVVVDQNDPAFKTWDKPIGAFMTEDQAKALAKENDIKVGEDSGRGWRRMVPSPVPQDIVELQSIENLMNDGCVVIAAGGGGVPVEIDDGKYKEVDAIIDKDLVSSILAWKIKADALILLTAVDEVYVNFNKPDQEAIRSMTTEQAHEYIKQGQFAPGSMLPKVEACVKFVEAHPGGVALITSLGHAAEGLRGKMGTFITSTK